MAGRSLLAPLRSWTPRQTPNPYAVPPYVLRVKSRLRPIGPVLRTAFYKES